MPDQLQLRGGTTVQHSTFTGASKEVTVDTTKKAAVVHDGSTVGGVPMMREDASNAALALGSAATPSLKFTGDSNTGIYSPGADQLAISTGGTARITVDGSGNVNIDSNTLYVDAVNNRVGIGASPADRASLEINAASSSIGGIRILQTTTGRTTANRPLFQVYDDQAGTTEKTVEIISNGTGDILSVRDGANTAFVVKDGGNVGINTPSPGGTVDIKAAASTAPLIVQGPSSEFTRIDSSGRLLVGTSTNIRGSKLQVLSTGNDHQAIIGGNQIAQIELCRSSDSAGGAGLVADGNVIARIECLGNDGSAYRAAARIEAVVDGTPGASDMPGRLVFSTTADGAASPTEALRITNDRVFAYNQPTPATYAAAATLTVADLKTAIITYTGTAATLTLPTGTLTEGGFAGIYTNMTFEWSVINTGAGICTIGAGTAHTIVGSATVAIGASARFASRRTAANTFVSYRLN